MRVVFEISQRDLKRFRSEMRRVRHSVRDADEIDILDAADASLAAFIDQPAPDFISERLPRLKSLINMMRDTDWAVPKSQRTKVLAVLAYFSDPDDLIPDTIPGLGLLDDAIMIELIFRDLHHDFEAFQDFCHYRNSYYKRHKIGRDAGTRAQRLKAKRKELYGRANRRKQKDRQQHAKQALF